MDVLIPRRTLTVPRFTRAPSSGVWYYHIDVAVLGPSSASPSASAADEITTSSPSAADEIATSSATSSSPSAVYSVLRRYSDFLELYDRVKDELVSLPSTSASASMPTFPEKEPVPPGLFGPLGRLSTPRSVLERRRRRFQSLLRWFERHPAARSSAALGDFLGPPPQEPDGYTSLKEYAAPHWLKAVQLAAAKGRQRDREADKGRRGGRARAYTMDALEGRRGSVSSNASSVKSEPPRPKPPLAMAVVSPREEEEGAGVEEPDAELEPEAGEDKEHVGPRREAAARTTRRQPKVRYAEPRRRAGRP